MGCAQHRPCRGKKWTEKCRKPKIFRFFAFFSLAIFMFEAFLVAFFCIFCKVFLVEVLPRKGHPGDLDDASCSFRSF